MHRAHIDHSTHRTHVAAGNIGQRKLGRVLAFIVDGVLQEFRGGWGHQSTEQHSRRVQVWVQPSALAGGTLWKSSTPHLDDVNPAPTPIAPAAMRAA